MIDKFIAWSDANTPAPVFKLARVALGVFAVVTVAAILGTFITSPAFRWLVLEW